MRKKWGKVVAMVLVCGGCLTACGTAKQENHSVVPTTTTTNTTNNTNTKESKATSSPKISKVENNNKKKDNPEKLKNIKLSVDRWDTKKADFSIEAIRFGTGGGGVVDFGQNWEFIAYEENLGTVLEKNPDYFVESLEYTDDENEKHKAARYFKNNNSYILYEKNEKGRKHNYLCLVNQMLTLDYPKYMSENQKRITFPYPCYKSLSNWEIEAAWENNEDLLEEKFWGQYSYEELKKFYSNFERTTAKCSDENQTIQVKAMEHVYEEKTGDVSIVIDFKHKNFVVEDMRGKKIFEKVDIWEDFEKQYTSAGKVGGKEFFYDKYSTNILCVEKGKRTACIDEDTRDILFEDDGFNCVGKSVEMKVSKKSNSQKIYLDATLYMEEEGSEWGIRATLMFDSKGKFVKRIS